MSHTCCLIWHKGHPQGQSRIKAWRRSFLLFQIFLDWGTTFSVTHSLCRKVLLHICYIVCSANCSCPVAQARTFATEASNKTCNWVDGSLWRVGYSWVIWYWSPVIHFLLRFLQLEIFPINQATKIRTIHAAALKFLGCHSIPLSPHPYNLSQLIVHHLHLLLDFRPIPATIMDEVKPKDFLLWMEHRSDQEFINKLWVG